MADTPNSYKDPYWSSLAGATEQKLGLPDGLLVSVLTKGERSNADQVSEAGARTPFQIIPATRVAAAKKFGIDAYLSPENAAEVAGLLLKDSLARNKGDVSAAVAEYHGGTDRSNWGPRTRAYVQRVVGATPAPVRDAEPIVEREIPAGGGQSTFDRVQAQMRAQQPDAGSIANVLAAYQAGRMTPEEAAEFEQDVQAGRVMLPRGAALKPAATGAPVLPAGVIQAYTDGRMAPEERAQLEADVKAGTVLLPQGMQLGQGGNVQAAIPGAPQLPPAQQPEPSLGEKALGAGEAALTAVTGGTTGAIGMAGGLLRGLAEAINSGKFGTPEAANLVERYMAEGAQALTYEPRTPAGQEYAGKVGEAMQNLVPVAGVAPALVPHSTAAPAAAAVADTARAVPPAVAQVARTAATATRGAVDAGLQRLPEAIRPAAREAAPTPGTLGSAGAAGTDMAVQRRALASDLPVPVELTKGQAERSFEQLRFEQETAKDPRTGAPLRERYAQQNQAILQNFDAWVDQTGAEAPSLRATGAAVDAALVKQAAQDKTQIRVAYKAAEKAGELEAPVALDNLVAHLNDSAPDAATAPLLDVARRRALQLGIAAESPDGMLAAQPVPLKIAETYRQAISRATDYEATNVRQSAIIKQLVDEATDGMGGDLYKQARALRTRYAQNYENRATIAKLLNVKRGTTDRQVALEDVFDHAVLKGSLDDVRNVRRVLHRSGDEGAQAWRELQGATANWIREQATKNVATDQRGNPIVSAAGLQKAIKTLDHDGKLEFVFGKQGAQQMRDIADLARVVYTTPPGAVNTSNTASVLLAALAEAGTWGGATGLPVPVLTSMRQLAVVLKDRRIQKRVDEALGRARAREKAKPGAAPAQPRTVH